VGEKEKEEKEEKEEEEEKVEDIQDKFKTNSRQIQDKKANPIGTQES
jgi:hypothetical protein